MTAILGLGGLGLISGLGSGGLGGSVLGLGGASSLGSLKTKGFGFGLIGCSIMGSSMTGLRNKVTSDSGSVFLFGVAGFHHSTSNAIADIQDANTTRCTAKPTSMDMDACFCMSDSWRTIEV